MRYHSLAITLALLVLVVFPVPQVIATPSDAQASESILKQTFTSIGQQDGWVLESGENTQQGGRINASGATLKVGDNRVDREYRSILSFNTANIPNNAVIVSATLKLRKQGIRGTNSFTTHGKLLIDIRKPFFGSRAALQSADFQATAGLESAGVVSATPIKHRYVGKLGNAALGHVNTTGLTQLRLHFALDDNDDMNADFVAFYSGNVNNLALRPKLIIKYYIPESPTATMTDEPCLPTITPTPHKCFDCFIPPPSVLSSGCPATSTPTITWTPTITPTRTITPTPTRTPTENTDPLTPTVTPTNKCFDC